MSTVPCRRLRCAQANLSFPEPGAPTSRPRPPPGTWPVPGPHGGESRTAGPPVCVWLISLGAVVSRLVPGGTGVGTSLLLTPPRAHRPQGAHPCVVGGRAGCFQLLPTVRLRAPRGQDMGLRLALWELPGHFPQQLRPSAWTRAPSHHLPPFRFSLCVCGSHGSDWHFRSDL